MGLSKLFEKCEKCPFVNTCDHKLMEALAYYPEPSVYANVSGVNIEQMAMPVLRETVTTIQNGERVLTYKDEIEKQLYKQLYNFLEIGG